MSRSKKTPAELLRRRKKERIRQRNKKKLDKIQATKLCKTTEITCKTDVVKDLLNQLLHQDQLEKPATVSKTETQIDIDVQKFSFYNLALENVAPLKNCPFWYCRSCEVSLPAGQNSAITHVEGKKHKSCHGKMVDFTTDKSYCEICKIEVVKDLFYQHNEGIFHQMEEKETEKSSDNSALTVAKMTKCQKSKQKKKETRNVANSQFITASNKVKLIVDAVTFSSNDQKKKEKEFLQRCDNFEQQKDLFIQRCNFCDELSESEILSRIHELSYHPIEIAALKELISLKK